MGCTITSSLENDEYDIDIMAELSRRLAGWPPRDVLDTLYMAIKGEKGSRYYDMTVRNTRCVTVHYSDMHLDVTPSLLVAGSAERTSLIFHSKREEPPEQDKRIVANLGVSRSGSSARRPRSQVALWTCSGKVERSPMMQEDPHEAAATVYQGI